MTPDPSAWGDCELVRSLTGGFRSDPFLVIRAGQPFVIRRTSRSEPQLHWLYRCIRLAQRAGLNPPAMIRTQRGHWAHRRWRMERFIPGKQATARDYKELRAPLCRFHAASRALEACSFAPPKGLPPQLANMLRKMLPAGPVGAIHGDLHAGNVIRNAKGQLCLIDWDEARTGPQTLDTMHLARKTVSQRRQHYAVEALEGWALEPEFARQLTKRVLIKSPKMRL